MCKFTLFIALLVALFPACKTPSKRVSDERRLGTWEQLAKAARVANTPAGGVAGVAVVEVNKVAFRFGPKDLTTNIGSTPIEVWIEGGRRVDDRVLKTLADSLRLVKWPERTPIDSMKEHKVPNGQAGMDAYTRILIQPQPSLETTRWFALMLDSVPPPFELSADPANWHRTGDGAIVSRFAVGSMPQITSFRERLAKGDEKGKYRLVVESSEPVFISSRKAALLGLRQVARGSVPCTVAEGLQEGLSSEWSYLCDFPVLDQLGVDVPDQAFLAGGPGLAIPSSTILVTPETVHSLDDGTMYFKVRQKQLD
jgi:hypothetical protein